MIDKWVDRKSARKVIRLRGNREKAKIKRKERQVHKQIHRKMDR